LPTAGSIGHHQQRVIGFLELAARLGLRHETLQPQHAHAAGERGLLFVGDTPWNRTRAPTGWSRHGLQSARKYRGELAA